MAGMKIPEVSKETLKLEKALQNLQKGEKISYEEIERLSGVKMNPRGRSYLTTATKRLNIVTATIRGWGIQRTNHEIVDDVLFSGMARGDSAYRKVIKKGVLMKEQHWNECDMYTQHNLNTVINSAGAILAHSKHTKVLLKNNKRPQISEATKLKFD